jgi:hypothetical protein
MSSLKAYFTPWVLVGAVLVACLASSLVLLILAAGQPAEAPLVVNTAIVNLIPAPSATLPVPTPQPTATTAPLPTVPSMGPLTLGALVQITGTGNDGLRLRQSPGLDGQILFVAIEAEVYRVTDGPKEVDGYAWWYLVNPYQESVQGWGVGNYLAVIQNP